MRFKQYLQEMVGYNPNQIVSNIQSINDELLSVLEGIVPSPEIGIEKMRNTLAKHNIALPLYYSLDTDGDEFVVDLNENAHLYTIYSSLDNGGYEFFAEITDSEGLEKLLSDEDDEEEID
jgi:hypothetical protein